MKKSFLLALMFAMAACGNNNADNNNASSGSDSANSSNNTNQPATPPAASSNNNAAPAGGSEKEKAIELIAASDCLTCHKIDEKLVGPAYRDVAKKYSNDEQTKKQLAQKVINGGSGVWGEVPMAAHPQISEADAETMVSYILSLKQ